MNKHPEQLQHATSEPVLFRLAKYLQRKDVRGSVKFERKLRSRGWLDLNVRYSISDNVAINVPICERSYDRYMMKEYETACVQCIADLLPTYDANFCLLDCGADIGLMSAKFVANAPSINKVIAFEPNATSYQYLKQNMKLLGIEAQAMNVGVADFHGKASLQWPEFDAHDHAAFVVPDENGDFEVTTIDSLKLTDNDGVFLKIDVEGAELDVVRGASETIRNAKHVVIMFEAHRKQAQRVGVDPSEIIRYVNSLIPCKEFTMECPDVPIDHSQPFFPQMPTDIRIFNVCIHT